VISVMAAILQGGTMGWRGPDCLEPQYSDDTEALSYLFEDVILNRLELAWAIEDPLERAAEMERIAAAAYQFGLQRVIAALEGRPE